VSFFSLADWFHGNGYTVQAAFLYDKQGLAMAWKKGLWLAIPLVALAGAYAGTSRFTWTFAPAMWVVMLTLVDAARLHGSLKPNGCAPVSWPWPQ